MLDSLKMSTHLSVNRADVPTIMHCREHRQMHIRRAEMGAVILSGSQHRCEAMLMMRPGYSKDAGA